MQNQKFALPGIKSMLSRDEMKKIKAGSGCNSVGVSCIGGPDGLQSNCPNNCRCYASPQGGGMYYCGNF